MVNAWKGIHPDSQCLLINKTESHVLWFGCAVSHFNVWENRERKSLWEWVLAFYTRGYSCSNSRNSTDNSMNYSRSSILPESWVDKDPFHEPKEIHSSGVLLLHVHVVSWCWYLLGCLGMLVNIWFVVSMPVVGCRVVWLLAPNLLSAQILFIIQSITINTRTKLQLLRMRWEAMIELLFLM